MTKAVLEAESESAARETAATVPSLGFGRPCKPARFADGAARPARPGEGSGADRGGDRARVLSCSVGCGGAQAGSGTSVGARPSHRGRLAVPAGHAAARDLSVQTCSGAGCGLRHLAARADDARFTLASPKYSKASSLILPTSQPELLARHCTEAGLIEKAASFWGKAGQRSLERSALVEAAEQLTRALEQMEALPATSSLRREQIKLQVALVSALIPCQRVLPHRRPNAATEKARLLIEQAEALGEPPEDPLLLFSVLYSFWVANYVAFKGDAVARSCGTVPGTRREARNNCPTYDWASDDGERVGMHGKPCTGSGTL